MFVCLTGQAIINFALDIQVKYTRILAVLFQQNNRAYPWEIENCFIIKKYLEMCHFLIVVQVCIENIWCELCQFFLVILFCMKAIPLQNLLRWQWLRPIFKRKLWKFILFFYSFNTFKVGLSISFRIIAIELLNTVD